MLGLTLDATCRAVPAAPPVPCRPRWPSRGFCLPSFSLAALGVSLPSASLAHWPASRLVCRVDSGACGFSRLRLFAVRARLGSQVLFLPWPVLGFLEGPGVPLGLYPLSLVHPREVLDSELIGSPSAGPCLPGPWFQSSFRRVSPLGLGFLSQVIGRPLFFASPWGCPSRSPLGRDFPWASAHRRDWPQSGS